MRRMLIIAAGAVAALGFVPATAAVNGSLCGDIEVVVNGEALVDTAECIPSGEDPQLPGAPELPGLPEAPGAPGLPGLPEAPGAPELPLPALPV